MRVCVVIPAYNEAARIGDVVGDARRYVLDAFVIDDGSTDGTDETARAAGARTIRLDANFGKGTALLAGFEAAIREGFDVLLTLDGDGQHDPREIPRFIERYEATRAAAVIGTRMSSTANMPIHRQLNDRGVTRVGGWLCGQSAFDFQCGFRLLETAALRGMKLETRGYELESELLVQIGRKGLRIEWLPIKTLYAEEESHVRSRREMLRYTRLFFRCISPRRLERPRDP